MISDILGKIVAGEISTKAALETARSIGVEEGHKAGWLLAETKFEEHFNAGQEAGKQIAESFTTTGEKVEKIHSLYRDYGKKNVFIRTVTHHYTGLFNSIDDDFIKLTDAAWIADDGRFSEAMKKGTLNEIEPFNVGPVSIGVGAILDISEWKHPLPMTQK